jgi:hypothetical protein
MQSSYRNCYNLTGGLYIHNKVKNIAELFDYCVNITGPFYIGSNVTNAYRTFGSCANLCGNIYLAANEAYTGSFLRNTNSMIEKNIYVHKNSNTLANLINPNAGASIFYNASSWEDQLATHNRYYAASKLTSVYPVDDVQRAYDENEKLVITYDSTNAELLPTVSGGGYRTYQNIINGVYHTNLCRTDNIIKHVSFSGKTTLTKVDYMSNNITSLYSSFTECRNLTGDPWCGPNVTNMHDAYFNCRKLTGSPVCGAKVTSMGQTYNNCIGLTGKPVVGANVDYMAGAYCNCTGLTGSPVISANVEGYFDGAYFNCYKLTGSPVCTNKITSMNNAYYNCTNLTGPAVCGTNVVNMVNTYAYCSKINRAVCSNSVKLFEHAYRNCTNIPTGVCGASVTTMNNSYAGCTNITTGTIGPNVVTARNAYSNCTKLKNLYIYSNKIKEPYNIVRGKSNSVRLNIYFPSTGPNTYYNTHYSIIEDMYYGSITGTNITWTQSGSNYYNTAYNIYLYPVSNVNSYKTYTNS